MCGKKEVIIRAAIKDALQNTVFRKTGLLRPIVNDQLPDQYKISNRELGQRLRSFA